MKKCVTVRFLKMTEVRPKSFWSLTKILIPRLDFQKFDWLNILNDLLGSVSTKQFNFEEVALWAEHELQPKFTEGGKTTTPRDLVNKSTSDKNSVLHSYRSRTCGNFLPHTPPPIAPRPSVRVTAPALRIWTSRFQDGRENPLYQRHGLSCPCDALKQLDAHIVGEVVHVFSCCCSNEQFQEINSVCERFGVW